MGMRTWNPETVWSARRKDFRSLCRDLRTAVIGKGEGAGVSSAGDLTEAYKWEV